MRDASLMPGKRAKVLALFMAGFLHLTVAGVAFWAPSQEPQGQAKAAGTGGIEISLGPAGSNAGGPKQEAGAEQTEPEPKPETKPKTVPKREPKPLSTNEPKPEHKLRPELQTEIEPQPESEPKQVQDAQPPLTTPVEKEQQQAPLVQATLAGNKGNSGNRNADQTGSGDNSAGGGMRGDTNDYAATLLAWLEKHREYPRRARMRRQEGTVLLYFVIDRSGRVLEQRIETSSGFSILDEEVLSMLQRSQPLPKMPGNVDKDRLEFLVPVQFYLRR